MDALANDLEAVRVEDADENDENGQAENQAEDEKLVVDGPQRCIICMWQEGDTPRENEKGLLPHTCVTCQPGVYVMCGECAPRRAGKDCPLCREKLPGEAIDSQEALEVPGFEGGIFVGVGEEGEEDNEEDNEQGDYCYGVTSRVVRITYEMAGGGPHWWNYVVEFEPEEEGEQKAVFVESSSGLERQDKELFTHEDGYHLKLASQEDMEDNDAWTLLVYYP